MSSFFASIILANKKKVFSCHSGKRKKGLAKLLIKERGVGTQARPSFLIDKQEKLPVWNAICQNCQYLEISSKGYEEKELPALSHKSLCILFNKTAQGKMLLKSDKIFFRAKGDSSDEMFSLQSKLNFRKWKITNIFIRENLCTEQNMFSF